MLKGTNQQSGGRAVNCLTQTDHMQLTKQRVPSASLGAPPQGPSTHVPPPPVPGKNIAIISPQKLFIMCYYEMQLYDV